MLGAVILSQATLIPIIQSIGAKYGVEPALIQAHIKAESNWDVNASRFEKALNDASWGLMQVLLSTAKTILRNPDLTTTQLIQPQTNIEAGTAYIAQNLKRYGGNVKDAIAAYNAGSARHTITGSYINQAYVDKVYGNYVMYAGLGPAFDLDDNLPIYLGAGLAIGLVAFSFFKPSSVSNLVPA